MERSDAADEDGFGEGAGVVESGAGGSFPEDGVDELVAMVTAGGFFEGEVLELVGRNDESHSDVGLDDCAVGSDEDGALVGEFFVAEERDNILWRTFITIVPRDFDGIAGGVFGSWEHVFDFGVDGPTPFVWCGTDAFHGDGRGEFERMEDGIVDVAAHVAERACSEVEAFAPVAGVVGAVDIGAFCGDAEPEVPCEALWYGIGVGGFRRAVAPLFAAPSVHLFDFSDDAGADDDRASAVCCVRVHLDSHLGDQLPLARVLGEFPHFINVLCKRLLEVAVNPELHGGHGLRAVHVVWGSDADGIDIFRLLFEEFAPVLVEASVRTVGAFAESFGPFCVDVGGGDHVNGRVGDNGADVCSCHPSGPEAGVANATTRGGGDEIADEGRGDDSGGAEGCQKRASGGMDQRHECFLAGAGPRWRWRGARRDCGVPRDGRGFNLVSYGGIETALDHQTGADGVRVGDILQRWAHCLDGGAELSGEEQLAIHAGW